MKILVYEWNGYGYRDIKEVFQSLGIEIDRIGYAIIKSDANREKKEEFLRQKLEEKINETVYDAVFSFNFFPVIASICNQKGIAYISWIYDSPCEDLYTKESYYNCNHIFVFDREVVEELRRIGNNRVQYLPLGVHLDRLEQLQITAEDNLKYASEISFVGQTYSDKISIDNVEFPMELRGYIEGILQAQKVIYGYDLLDKLLNEKLTKEILNYYPICETKGACSISKRQKLLWDMGRMVTKRERIEILEHLAKNHQVNLYTEIIDEKLQNVNMKGGALYFCEAPKIFRLSKINLNITLKTIKSGIPLRVMDIVGAGGFCISNYQQGILEEFEENKEIVLYYGLKDLEEKVNYYLKHDAEREQIQRNALERVKQCHTMRQRVEQMLRVI